MSVVVKEVITDRIDYWSPPLKKHRYQMSIVEKRAYIPADTPSGILMKHIQEREKVHLEATVEKEVPKYEPAEHAFEDAQYFSGFLNEIDTSCTEKNDKDSSDSKRGRRFRALKRIEKLIYDDSAIRQGELEDEAFELLNQDGFYDEILPVDYDEETAPVAKLPVKTVALYFALLLLLVGIFVGTIKIILF